MNMHSWNHARSLRRAATALALIGFLLLPAGGHAEEFIEAAKTAMSKLAGTGALLGTCRSYDGLTPRGGCTPADPAGFGLRCPTTTRTQGGTPENCESNVMNQLKLALNWTGQAKLEASALNTARIHADIEPRESVSHDHSGRTEEPGTCDSVYIARKDFVRFLFALYNSAEVSVGMTDTQFEAQVAASEGFSHRYAALICGWKQHPEPRTCGLR
jgi:hypothetical protein